MANAWFRMYAEFATDPKVQSMPEAMQRRLTMLFCMRCSDVTVTLSDDEIAFALRISDEELATTKALFMRKGFISDDWSIANWDKRQFSSDSSAERTRAYRERQKQKQIGNETSQKRHGDALDTDTDTESDTDKKKKKAKAPAAPSPVSLLTALEVGEQVANDWLAIRKQKRLPFTQTALEGLIAETEKAGLSLHNALLICCNRGWGSFEAAWLDKPQSRQSVPYESKQDKVKSWADRVTGNHHDKRTPPADFIDVELIPATDSVG
jgi:hypothetical protein